MKKTFFLCLFVLFAFSSFGQKIRFTDSTNKWKVYQDIVRDHLPDLICLYNEWFAGDTTINFQHYQILLSNNPCYWLDTAYIREDTFLNKVFILRNDTEQVFMDYTLQLGDSIVYFGADYGRCAYFVDSLDSVVIDGNWYKVWDFYPCLTCNSSAFRLPQYKIMEGIGCLYGSFFLKLQNLDLISLSMSQLRCFSNKGSNPGLSNPIVECPYPSTGMGAFYYDNGSSCTVGVNQVAKKTASATVDPNPIDQSSKIVFPSNISSASVAVFNDLGQTVINLPFQNKDEILIGDKIKVPGIYYYRVMDNEKGTVYSGKSLKQ